ncbi:hypothetical protein NKH70_30330 [Mesorhizobium sp. M0991]|uniref:hypothetical protein n=1 Tax=Mesorhizobium sp. M0991 TaxID=2957043 RepID=UPI0033390F0B
MHQIKQRLYYGEREKAACGAFLFPQDWRMVTQVRSFSIAMTRCRRGSASSSQIPQVSHCAGRDALPAKQRSAAARASRLAQRAARCVWRHADSSRFAAFFNTGYAGADVYGRGRVEGRWIRHSVYRPTTTKVAIADSDCLQAAHGWLYGLGAPRKALLHGIAVPGNARSATMRGGCLGRHITPSSTTSPRLAQRAAAHDGQLWQIELADDEISGRDRSHQAIKKKAS